MAPSPTADATRFIESSRTSPAANTPGTLASRANGARVNGQPTGVGGGQQVLPGDEEPLGVADDLGAQPVACAARHR